MLSSVAALGVIEPQITSPQSIVTHGLVGAPHQRTITDAPRARPREPLLVAPGARRAGRRIADHPIVATSEVVAPMNVAPAVKPASIREDRVVNISAGPDGVPRQNSRLLILRAVVVAEIVILVRRIDEEVVGEQLG